MSLAEMSESKRPIVFLGVGVVNTLLDFTFYSFLTSTAFSNGRHIAVAGFVSGTFALFCAFVTHSLITWRGHPISHRTLVKFMAFTGFGMWIIRPLLLSGFIRLTPLYHLARTIITAVGIPLSYNFVANTGAFALMLVIVLSYNYFVYSKFVFTGPNRTEPENRSAS